MQLQLRSPTTVVPAPHRRIAMRRADDRQAGHRGVPVEPGDESGETGPRAGTAPPARRPARDAQHDG